MTIGCAYFYFQLLQKEQENLLMSQNLAIQLQNFEETVNCYDKLKIEHNDTVFALETKVSELDGITVNNSSQRLQVQEATENNLKISMQLDELKAEISSLSITYNSQTQTLQAQHAIETAEHKSDALLQNENLSQLQLSFDAMSRVVLHTIHNCTFVF